MYDSTTTVGRSRLANDVLTALTEAQAQGDAGLSVPNISDELMLPEDQIRAALLELGGESPCAAVEVDADFWRAGDICPELVDADQLGLFAGDDGDLTPAAAGEPEAVPPIGEAGEPAAAPMLPATAVATAEVVPDGEGPSLPEDWTAGDDERLESLEGTVGNGLRAFYTAGLALRQIRDERLYRRTHATFEEYLRDRWDIGDSQGYRIIEAADVQSDLAAVGVTLARESHCRPLVRLSSELRQAVGQRLAEIPKVTADAIDEARRLVEEERAVSILAAASEPMTGEDLAAAVGSPDCHSLATRLLTKHLAHRSGTGWQDPLVAGPPVYTAMTVSIPAELVERIESTTSLGVQNFVMAAIFDRLRRLGAGDEPLDDADDCDGEYDEDGGDDGEG